MALSTFQGTAMYCLTGVLMVIERYTSVWMATCLMQKQHAVRKKSMSHVLMHHLIHARGEVMVYMQTTVPIAKITTGIYTLSFFMDISTN
jgi:hypothetical protein